MKKVLCFGEILMRLSPEVNGDWLKNNIMPIYIGGAELNVATALAKWNVPVGYATAMPDNYLSAEIKKLINNNNIDSSYIHNSGNRIGIYYLQQGADMKNAGVIYDRAHSSFSELKPGMIDWDSVLHEVSWFHFSAISPALNQNAVEVCKEALQAASKKGITISVDLNYRAKLWQYGKKPVDVMPELVAYCNVVMGNIWAANTLLGIEVDPEVHLRDIKEEYIQHSKKTADAIQSKFMKCKVVAHTFRFDHGTTGIKYFTCLHKEEHSYISPEFIIEKIVDKVGSGDCFMGGLIYGFQHDHSPQNVIDFAASAAVGKLQEKGDFTNQTINSIQQRLTAHGQA
ncbi:MAG TPA: sugar kinase [Segetibacter sp.]